MNINQITYAKKTVAQYEILEERYLSKNSGKERFSVSTQHYNFAIKAFTDTIKLMDPEKSWRIMILTR